MCYFFLLYIPPTILFASYSQPFLPSHFFSESWPALVPRDPTVGCRGVVWGGRLYKRRLCSIRDQTASLTHALKANVPSDTKTTLWKSWETEAESQTHTGKRWNRGTTSVTVEKGNLGHLRQVTMSVCGRLGRFRPHSSKPLAHPRWRAWGPGSNCEFVLLFIPQHS